jgi:prepilin-type N-terminal cleavage/methylation domain-containing protein
MVKIMSRRLPDLVSRWSSNQGTTLIELMVAMVVLSVGLAGTTILLSGTIASDSKNSRDTTATLLAQMVMEQISAQHVYSNATINVSDCAGNSWAIATTPGAAGTGNGATLKSDGTIDFTQSNTGLLTTGYAMQYVDCSTAGGVQTTYDVRWNVMNVSANTSTRLITTAARPSFSNASQLGGVFFALPVTLRGIGGPSAGQ